MGGNKLVDRDIHSVRYDMVLESVCSLPFSSQFVYCIKFISTNFFCLLIVYIHILHNGAVHEIEGEYFPLPTELRARTLP